MLDMISTALSPASLFVSVTTGSPEPTWTVMWILILIWLCAAPKLGPISLFPPFLNPSLLLSRIYFYKQKYLSFKAQYLLYFSPSPFFDNNWSQILKIVFCLHHSRSVASFFPIHFESLSWEVV